MVSLTAKEPSRQTRRPSQDRVGDGERNIGQREGDEAGRGRKEEEARECTSCGGMGAGVRGAQNLWAHRRIGGVTLAALARINKHRWVVVGGSAAVAARRASENDARDATLASGTGESGAPLDARCTRASQRRPRRGRGTRPTLVSGRVSGDSFDRGPYPEREKGRKGSGGGQPKCRPRNESRRRAGAADAPVPQRASLNLVFKTRAWPRRARSGQHEIPCCVRPRSSRRSLKWQPSWRAPFIHRIKTRGG